MLALYLLVGVLFSGISEIKGGCKSLRKEYVKLQEYAKHLEDTCIIAGIYNKTDCADLYKDGYTHDGVYTLYPSDGNGPMEVYCDMTTGGGGWTVFQKRLDGSVDFFRDWNAYKNGFGSLAGEFWLGNDNINRLTNQGSYTLRVDLEDTTGNKRFAIYSAFSVASENTNYKLSLGSYSGDAGDSLAHHHGKYFATKDRDNAIDCAITFKGGWWYGETGLYCHDSNLNGIYHGGAHSSYADGVNWNTWKGYHYSLKRTSMKFRPVGF